jgi:hypothetical protein
MPRGDTSTIPSRQHLSEPIAQGSRHVRVMERDYAAHSLPPDWRWRRAVLDRAKFESRGFSAAVTGGVG